MGDTTYDDDFAELWSLAYRVAYRVLGDREEAADVAQDAMVKLHVKWRTASQHAAAFVGRVAGDRAIDVWRHRGRAVVPDAGAGIDLEGAEVQRRALVVALAALPTLQRRVVVLRYLADLSEADTAAALHRSVGTVKTSASRGLGALRSALREPEGVRP